MKIIQKKPSAANEAADTADLSSRRFQIVNEAISKLYMCRAVADLICFEEGMPEELDEGAINTLKFGLWGMLGEVLTLIDTKEMWSVGAESTP